MNIATFARGLIPGSLVLMLTGIACAPTEPDRSGLWGSDQVGLTIEDNRTTLQIVSSGDCYGSYGEIDHAISSGDFTLSGTFTQLIGAYPGSVQYAAQYVGTITGEDMVLSIHVPDLKLILGPYTLTSGVVRKWPACQFP